VIQLSAKDTVTNSSRENILNQLDSGLKATVSGKKQNTLILGRTGLGKTKLLKQYFLKAKAEKLLSIFIPLEKISLSPENFAVSFAGRCLHAYKDADASELKSYLDLQKQKKLCMEIKSKELLNTVNAIDNELQKIKPDQKLLITTALKIPEILAQHSKKKCTVFIDNFENILSLNNFEQIKNILELCSSFFSEAPDVSFAITSSLSLKLSPAFDVVTLQPLNEVDTSSLIKQIVKGADAKLTKQIFELSHGEPWLIENLCKQYLITKDITKAYVSELLYSKSTTSLFIKNYYHATLSKARGETLIKLIMDVLADFSKEKPRLSEIARQVYRSAPVTKALLERLIASGLVEKKDNYFLITSRVLADWLRLRHLEVDEMDDEQLDSLVNVVKKIRGEEQ